MVVKSPRRTENEPQIMSHNEYANPSTEGNKFSLLTDNDLNNNATPHTVKEHKQGARPKTYSPKTSKPKHKEKHKSTESLNESPIPKRTSRKDKTLVNYHSTDEEMETSCLLYTSPSPRDKRQSRMPSSA